MYAKNLFVLRRTLSQISFRLSSSTHTFPNEDFAYTIKSPNDHIRSALYPMSAADYPKQVLPDLHLIKLFRDIELLKENCEQRNLKIDVHQLASDYQSWLEKKKEFRRLRDLHYMQERLRISKNDDDESKDLSMTDTNEMEQTKVKKRKKKPKTASSTDDDAPATTTPAAETKPIEHASELISSVDNAWIDAVAHPSKSKYNEAYLRGEALMPEEEFIALKHQYDQFREQFRLFDQRFLVACLHLPAAQHIAVPAKPSQGVTIYESSLPIVKHPFNSKTWHELCHVENSDVSIFGSYWLGAAPLHKHQLIHFICSELTKLGFQEMSSISMTKPFIHEALGANINESQHVLTTFERADDSRSRSLISSGLGSFASLLVPFIRRTMLQTDLPYFVFTQGATYDVNQEQTFKVQLLAMTDIRDIHLKNFYDPLIEEPVTDLQPQTANVSIDREHEYNDQLKNSLQDKKPFRFHQNSSLDDLFLELNRLMYNIYEKFRLPYRIQNCPSDKLRSYESMRLDYELFLPSTNSYVCVGSISLIGDYLSRRLMIRHKRDKEEKQAGTKEKPSNTRDVPTETKFNYVQLIHVQVIDVDMLTKCYVEKQQRSFPDKNILGK